MAINTDFNVSTGAKAPRKLLKHFVNVGTSGEKEWELLGVGIEDSAIETNFETETVNDILGNTETSITAHLPRRVLSRSPFVVALNSHLSSTRFGSTKSMKNFHSLKCSPFMDISERKPMVTKQICRAIAQLHLAASVVLLMWICLSRLTIPIRKSAERLSLPRAFLPLQRHLHKTKTYYNTALPYMVGRYIYI